MQSLLPAEWFPVAEAAERAGVDPVWLAAATDGGWVVSLVVAGERLVSSWAIEELVG